jgi:hypothetical protein
VVPTENSLLQGLAGNFLAFPRKEKIGLRDFAANVIPISTAKVDGKPAFKRLNGVVLDFDIKPIGFCVNQILIYGIIIPHRKRPIFSGLVLASRW